MRLLLLLPLALQDPPDLPVPEGMVRIEGECISSLDRSPVPGVHLTMRDPTQGCRSPETQTTVSDEEGRFRFAPFPVGRRRIVTRSPADAATRKAAYPPTEHEVVPNAAGVHHLRVVLGEFGSVRGKVVDAETGAPVRGGQATLRVENVSVPIHAVDGTFQFSRIALRNRSQQVVFDAPGYAQTWGVLEMAEKAIEGMTIRMRRARTLTGSVRDAAGKPAPSLWVEVQGSGVTPALAEDGTPEVREDSPGRLDVRGAETDSLGRYRVDGLDPDFTWSVALKSMPAGDQGMKSLPFRKEGLSAFSFGPKDLVKTVDLSQVEGMAIRGSVVDEDGKPLAGAGILLCAASIANEILRERAIFAIEPGVNGGPERARWTEGAADAIAYLPDLLQGHVRFREAHLRGADREGRFAFEGVEPGPHLVFVRMRSHETRTLLREIGPDLPEWRIVLRKSSEVLVAGRVEDERGEGVAGARVKAVAVAEEPGELGWSLAEATTAEGGTFSLHFTRGGPFVLRASEGARRGEAREPLQGSASAVEIRVR